ncbi:hypothetical protein ACF0H5_003364 [Mactra antiquata]
MEGGGVNNGSSIKRAVSSAAPEIADSLYVSKEEEKVKKSVDVVRKSASLDSGDVDTVKKFPSTCGSFKRRSIRRRSSKRVNRPEPEFGHDTETYEKIRERVLQERAVTNAIEALQERYRMLTFMYDDCIELNEDRKSRRLRKLCVQRQFELIVLISLFITICLPVSIILIFICR